MNEKTRKMIITALIIIAIIFLLIFIFTKSGNKKYSFNSFEEYLVKNTKKYYEKHEEELPTLNSIKSFTLSDLENTGIISSLDKVLEKNTNCSGTVTIENNNNYYMFSPNIECSNLKDTYKTYNLKDILHSKIVTTGNGLYDMGNGFYFRGEDVENYIIFDGILWRIVKLNIDGTIKIIEDGRRKTVAWDNSFNSEKNYKYGINDFINSEIGINSSIKNSLDNIYESEDIISNEAKGYIKKTDLCIGKRSTQDTINDGSIECSNVIENQYLGLLQLNEYFIASLDTNCIDISSRACSNYNYLANFDSSYWTLTANKDNTYQVFMIKSLPALSNASSRNMNRLVINISSNTNVKGEGTKDNPYVVAGFDSNLKDLK